MPFKLRPDMIFVILGSLFGIAFVFLTPPFQAPDEYEQFYRAVHVGQGEWLAIKEGKRVGGYLPESIAITGAKVANGIAGHPEIQLAWEDIWNFLNFPLNDEKRIFYNFPNMGLYSPVPFFPQSIGIAFARAWDASPLVMLYAGRLSNLAVWLAIVMISIRWLPMFQWVFVLLALMPMSLFMASSVSADVATNALGFLWTSLILHLSFSTRPVSFSKWGLLFGVGWLLILTKHAYISLLFLILMIPKHRRLTLRYYWVFLTVFGVSSLITFLAWSEVIRDLFVPANPAETNISIEGQTAYIFNNTWMYLQIAAQTLISSWSGLAHEFVGVLGWLDTPLDPKVVKLYWGILVFVAVIDFRERLVVSFFQKGIVLITLLGSCAIVITSAYLKWNSVGKPWIDGLQGRYFIPLAPLLFLLLYNTKLDFKLWIPKFSWLISCYLLGILGYTSWVLLNRYYLGL